MNIEGLKFVITGGASGMGAATAKLAAGYGASVVIADLNEEKSRAVVDQIRSKGGQAWYKQCDITIDDNLSDLMEFAADSMGGIDVLHNNAGVVDAMFGTAEKLALENYSREIWDKVIAVNLTAPLFASKAALPFLRKSSNPSVIIAASVSSYFGNPQIIACGSSKGGVALLTKNLANAAQAPEMRSGPLLDIESEVMNLMWRSGPVATLEFMRASHSCLKQGGGVIINFCTVAMFKPQNNGVYAAVKSAIQMITRAAAMEWVDDGIRANAVVPLINSPVFEAYCEKDPAFVEQFVSTIPLKRMGDPELDKRKSFFPRWLKVHCSSLMDGRSRTSAQTWQA